MGRTSRESRLMGGVGISAMGRLMDKVMSFKILTRAERSGASARTSSWGSLLCLTEGAEELKVAAGTRSRTSRLTRS